MARDRRARRHRARRRARRRRAPARRAHARSARWRSGLRESDLRHERASDDRLERRVGASLSRGRAGATRSRCAASRGGRDRPRQDRRRRFRLSWQRHEQPHRTGAQSARPYRHAHARRIERRLGGRRRGRNGVRRTRHRRRRLESHSGAVHRRRRNEADVRPRAAHRRDSDVAVPRHARTARAHGRRRGAPARRDRRCRCVGSARAHRQRGTAHRSPRCATTRSPACDSGSSKRTCRARR